MLRFTSTQIGLEVRDLNWHRDRHYERQILRTNGSPVRLDQKSDGRNLVQPNYPGLSLPIRPSTSQSVEQAQHPINRGSPLLSNDPIPRDSRAFWNKVLADAGTPTKAQETVFGNGELVEPSFKWLASNRSSKASIESSSDPDAEDMDCVGLQKQGLESLNIEDKADARLENHCQTSSASFYSSAASRISEETVETFLPGASGPSTTKSRFASLFHKKSKQEGPDNSLGSPQSPGVGDYDGASDPYRHASASADDASSDESADGCARYEHNDRTISANWEAFVNESAEMSDVDLPLPRSNADFRPPSPMLPTPRRAVATLQHQPSGLRRSLLHISQASSPDKGPRATSDQGGQLPGPSGLLSQAPRRRNMRYRPRSQSYSYVASEESYHSALPQFDGLAASPATITSSSPPDNILPGLPRDTAYAGASFNTGIALDDIHIPSSPPQLPNYHSGPARSQSSFAVGALPGRQPREVFRVTSSYALDSSPSGRLIDSHTPLPYRNLTPYQPADSSRYAYHSTFTPDGSRHTSQTHLPLPPPFSATRRNTSLNLAAPLSPSSPSGLSTTSSPARRLTSHPPTSPHTPPNTTPFRGLSDFDQPPPIAIYNDAIPPTIQPQTPADLSRTGQYRYASQNPFNSAPPRMRNLGGSGREAALAAWNYFPRTPRARVGMGQDAENFGRVTSEERLWRRMRGMEVGMGREERERLGL